MPATRPPNLQDFGQKRSDTTMPSTTAIRDAIKAKWGSPRAAMMALGLDEDMIDEIENDPDDDDPDDVLAQVLDFLRTRLSPEDMAELTELIGADPDDDQPPPFE